MSKLTSNREEFGKELRQVVVETLNEMIEKDPTVVALEADLGGASGFSKIAKENLINVGIAEANMVGVASGLNLTGFVPYLHTFSPFATRRAFDQLYLSGGYSDTHLNIYGSDPGFTAGVNGGTHTSYEDVALMRMIPNSVICDAADEVQLKFIVQAFKERCGVNYFRANRKAVRKVYQQDSEFELGKGVVLRTGEDVALIASGQLVSQTLDVAEKLATEGIQATVIDMFTVKPIDKELILKTAQEIGKIVTIENHSIYGGLGSSVAEFLAENGKATLKRIGVDERFGQVGTPDFLQKEYGLDMLSIYQKVKEIL
ncbi:transketolase [Pilibacter termitis]|uniref:Transketolase n=1 Tax=Pilibacter termitis TaxID=263852 RepID=A0A1T4Q6K0_9ENTE|nr:transketolase C-terminal domain-containing protein [Pilibacter termitis]SJZ99314.1 transketolase [Pilibacter termitis]